jgi:hypothetical protein
MGLYERWTGESEKIAVHTFAAALRELARGSVTKPEVINTFELTADEVLELDAIIGKYVAVPTEFEKKDFITKLHDVMLLSEAGFYPKNKAKTELGF